MTPPRTATLGPARGVRKPRTGPVDLGALTWALSPRQLIIGAAAWVAFSGMGTAVSALIVDVYEGTSLH